MDDLIADFIAETREMLDALGGEIVAWEAEPSERGRLDAIFRFVHTVKGNCGFFDLPRLEALSHAAEDALSDVRGGRREPDSRLVSAVLGIIGFFVIPVLGLVIGFVLGVYLAELAHRRDQRVAWTSTVHAVKGVVLSVGVELCGALLATMAWVAGVYLTQ